LVYLTVFAPGGMPYFNKKFNLNSYTSILYNKIFFLLLKITAKFMPKNTGF